MNAFLSKLKISHKLLISSLAFSLPIAVLLYFMNTAFNARIYLSTKEMYGNRMLQPLHDLVEYIPEHQRLAYFCLLGETGLIRQRDEVAEKVEQAFQRLLAESQRYAQPLNVDETALQQIDMLFISPGELQKSWQELHKQKERIAPTVSNRKHRVLLRDIMTLLNRIGDTSNMVLDPDLDTNYLVDVVLLAIPRAQERLGEILFFGYQSLSWGSLTKEDRIMFAVHASKLKEADRDRIIRSIETASRENKGAHHAGHSLQENIQNVLTDYISASHALLKVLEAISEDTAANISKEEFIIIGSKARSTGSALRKAVSKELEDLLQEHVSRYVNRRMFALMLTLSALVIATGLVVFISVGITRPLGHISAIAADIAKGNIQKARKELQQSRYASGPGKAAYKNSMKDEVGLLFRAMDTMAGSLFALLDQVRKSGIQVTSSATRISAAVHQLEATVAEQASSTSQVSATGKQITATSQELADTITDVTKKASNTADMAGSGYEGLTDIKETMQQLHESTENISEKLFTISEKARNIGQVIITITKVADQTNMLSLNAAIEADKAGEHGRGFSVVSREIRRLADQTAVSTQDIEQMVKEMESAVENGVETMTQFTTQVRSSWDKVSQIGDDLMHVIKQTRELGPRFTAVNQGMQMQSQGAEQISQSMEQLSEVAGHTKEALTDFKQITDQLDAAVEGLKHEVQRFSLDV